MSEKGFFKQAISEKQSSFHRLKKLQTLIAQTSINERLTGDVRDWSILQLEWLANSKFDVLTLIWSNLRHIAFSTCKRVKITAKVWFSMLICSTFKAFMKA